MKNKFVVAIVALALMGSVALAQEQVGAIVGTVSDEGGQPLPGATVEAKGPAGTLVAVTDTNGAYRFPRLPVGTYTLAAKLSGFVEVESEGVRLALGQTLTVNFTLRAGQFAEAITVAADQVQIDVKGSAAAMSIRGEDLDLLPKGRDFTTLVTQAPGAANESMAGGITIDGASGSENRFVIDGIDTTHPQDGLSGQGLVFDVLDEVQVKSAGYAAEFGGSLGGVINAITKTGGNQFKGSVNLYYGDSSWNGDERPVPYESNCPPNGDCYIRYKKDDETRIEPGFQIGGPILRDKLWFYVAYQPTFRDIDRTPMGSTATFNQKRTYQYFVGNLKGNLGNSFLYKFAVNMSPWKWDGVLPNRDGSTPAGSDLDVQEKYPISSYSLYGDYIASNNFLVSARAGRFTTNTETSGIDATARYYFRSGNMCTLYGVCAPDPRYRPTGFSSVPAASFYATDEDKWTRDALAVDSTVFFNGAGSHEVKFGVQYEKVENTVSYGENGNLYEIRWGLPDRFGAGVKGTYGSLHVRRFRTEGAAESKNLGLFIQDKWSPLPNLTINVGVRAEKEQIPNYGHRTDPTLPQWAIEFNFQDKLAPRVGFAWDVFSNQKMKVYGSWGKYYDITKLEMPRGSFGADHWIAYLYPLNTLDWQTIAAGCSISTNNPSVNPCPALGTPVTRDLRHPTDPREAIDPDLKPMENREFQLGTEYQLTSNTMLSARYVNKKLINTIEDIGYLVCATPGDLTSCEEQYITGNPGKGIVAGDPDGSGPIPPQAEAIRDYQALELTYNRRFADNWMLRASYTYSKLSGNYSGLASSDEIIATPGQARTDPNVARYFDGLVYGYDSKGRLVDGVLNTDRPHVIELYGLYRLPFGTNIGVATSWRSGAPTSELASYNGVEFFPYGRNNLGRTPSITQTDLYIAHPFKIGGLDFEVNLNVINLFDEDEVMNYYTYSYRWDVCDASDECDGSNEWYFAHLVPYDYHQYMDAAHATKDPFFMKPYSFQAPRSVRLGFKLSF